MANDMVTREEAERVLALVEKKFAGYLKTFATCPGGEIDFDTLVDVPESERPHLAEDYAGEGRWAIVWESGSPDGWAYGDLAETYVDPEMVTALRDEFKAQDPERLASSDGVQGMPEGVIAEPYYSFVLVLYK